jgi:uncharacterized protein (DUF849 family)
MYFTDDSLLPENQEKLIITAAPYGPQWLPSDYPEEIPLTWDQHVRAAIDCYNAGATHLHIHVRSPKTGRLTTNFEEFNDCIGRLKQAVPRMILSVGGSISFVPKNDNEKAKWIDFDTRHLLAELNPKPDQVTISIGTAMTDVTQMWTPDDIQGTHLTDPTAQTAWSGLCSQSSPAFYVEHLKRLRQSGIQPYFMLGYVHQLEIVERLIRAGLYAGPLNHCLSAVGGGAAGRNPFDWMEYLRRSPHGSILTFESTMRTVTPMCTMAIALGIHVRVGIEDNIWRKKGERFSTVKQVEQMVRLAREVGREVATAEEARKIMKIGAWYKSAADTLVALGLPPNRKDGQLGFVGYPSDGRLTQGAAAYCGSGPEESPTPLRKAS